jgi:hypothetical protein
MTVADWALVVSLCSVAIALGSFVWNIWSVFIFPKAKVRVSFSMSTIFHPGTLHHDKDVLTLSATNMGPGDVTLHGAIVRRKKAHLFQRRHGYSLLNPLIDPYTNDSHGPFSGGLPKKVGVGESFSVYLIPNHTILAEEGYDRIGFDDTFGRHHWAPKSQIVKTKPHIKAAIEQMGPAPA